MPRLLDIDFEVEDTSEFDSVTDAAKVVASAAAAMAGTGWGLSITMDGTTDVYGSAAFTWSSVNDLRLRFYLDPNGISLADTGGRNLVLLREDGVGDRCFVQFRDNSGTLQVQAGVVDDGSANRFTGWGTITDEPHWIEVHWVRSTSSSSNDASVTIYADGTELADITGQDVFDISRPDTMRIGWNNGPGSDSDTFYLDEIVLSNESTELGAVELSMLLARATVEVGDMSEFTSVSAGMSATAGAALAGSNFGVNVDTDDAVAKSAQLAYTRTWFSDVLRYRFHWDPNGQTFGDSAWRTLCLHRYTPTGGIRSRVEVRNFGGNLQVRAMVLNDSSVDQNTSTYVVTDAEHFIEVRVKRSTTVSSNDGTLTLWIDGVEKEEKTGLDIFSIPRPDAARFEWSDPHASDAGDFYLDELEVRDQDREIGSAVHALRGVLSITVAGATVSYVQGLTRKFEQHGADPGTFTFHTDDSFDETGAVAVTVSWQDDAGNVNRTEKFFEGTIDRVRQYERDNSRQLRHEVKCVDERHRAAQTLITDAFSEGTVSAVAAKLDAKLPAAFTVDAETGPTVGPFDDWQDRTYPECAAEIARDGAMLFWINYDQESRFVLPDSLLAGYEFYRDVPDETWASFDYTRIVGQIVNEVRVKGADGALEVRTNDPSDDVYGTLPHVYEASTVAESAVLQNIGDKLLDAWAEPTVTGKGVCTLPYRLKLGENFTITDLKRKGTKGNSVKGLAVRIENIDWVEGENQRWSATANFTNEKLVGRLEPEPEDDPEDRFVEDPDVDRHPDADNYIVVVRHGRTDNKLKLKLHSKHASETVSQAFRLTIKAKHNLTVTRTLKNTDAGEDVEIRDSGTRRVQIISTLSGDPGRWSIANEWKRLDLAVTGNLEGATCQAKLYGGSITGSVDDVVDAIYVGETEILADRDIRRRIRFSFKLERERSLIYETANSQNIEALVGEALASAGLLDVIRTGRWMSDIYAAGGVSRVINKLGHIEAALLHKSGGKAVNRAFMKALESNDDDFGSVPDDAGGTWRKIASINASNLAIVASLSTAGQVLSSTLGSGSFVDVDTDEFENKDDLDTDVRFARHSHSNNRESYENTDVSNQGYAISREWIATT